jgi:prolyl 4-hydroxylase
MDFTEEKFYRPNEVPLFIGSYQIDVKVCERLIDFFESNPIRQTKGEIDGGVDKSAKDSTDLMMMPGEGMFDEYMTEVWRVMENYTNEYGYAGYYGPWTSGPVNIQRYFPCQGFRVWHTERTGAVEPMGSRHLVFMTYLNDVVNGGGTEFFYQRKIYKPSKGLTLIWPSDWTFTHRGLVSKTETKYITTGWMNYVTL